jgi:CheY-like chemotaxis protein
MSLPMPKYDTVLVVEDYAYWQQLFKTMLPDFAVVIVEKLADAVVAVKNMRWEAILLDLGLPDSKNWETWRVLHRYAGDTPMMVVTASDREPDPDLLVRVVGKDALVKDPTMCQRLVYELIEERHEVQARYPAEDAC